MAVITLFALGVAFYSIYRQHEQEKVIIKLSEDKEMLMRSLRIDRETRLQRHN